MTTTPHAPEKVAGGVHVANAPGTTEISVRTLERIVAQAIKAVPGTVGIDSKLAGIGGRGYPRSIVKPIRTPRWRRLIPLSPWHGRPRSRR